MNWQWKMPLFCLVFLVLAARPSTGSCEEVVYYHTDAQGSVVAVTDANGNVIERTRYAPYGETINRPLHDGPGYTGHETDAATGLVYAQQRYYDPVTGRFLSVDPVTADDTTGANFNRYWYSNNNPYRYKDPNGQSPLEIAFLIADVVELGSAISSGSGIGVAAAMVAVDVVGVASPVPGVSEAAHAIEGGAKVADIAKGVDKAAQMAKNAQQGAKAEKAAVKEMGDKVAGTRVTLESSTGQRSVADIVTKDKGVVEVKSGNAQLSSGQKAIKADVDAGREVIPRGQNAEKAGLTPNQPVQLKCYDVKRC